MRATRGSTRPMRRRSARSSVTHSRTAPRGRLLHGLVHPEMGHIPMPPVTGDSFAGVRRHLREALAGHVASPTLEPPGIDAFLVPPELGEDAGVCWGLARAQDAAERQ